MFAHGLEFLPDLPQIVMFGRNKGQKLSNFDDEVDEEALSLANNTSSLASADEPIFPVSPTSGSLFQSVGGRKMQHLAARVGSISGESTLGIDAHLVGTSPPAPSCQDSPTHSAKVLKSQVRRSAEGRSEGRDERGIDRILQQYNNQQPSAHLFAPHLASPSQTTGEMAEIPTNLSPPGQVHAFPNHNAFDTLGGDEDPILVARVDNVYRLKKQCEPLEEKTRRLHDHVSELYKSIQKVCDDFHQISNDISDLMPPSMDPEKNVSHKSAANHEDVHNMVGVAIPAKIMPRFEQSLLGDLDLMMLHFVQEQVQFRKFRKDQIAMERRDEEVDLKSSKKVDASTEASIILKQENLSRNLKKSSELSENGLTNLLEKEKDMLDAWFYKFMQFQIHFFSEVGRQVMNLQGPSAKLADQLKKRKLDPSESSKILGDVVAETVVASPGWGTEHEDASNKSWFGIKGNKSPGSADEKNKWMQGMFRRRNVDFFKAGGGPRGGGGGFFDEDDEEDDSTSTPSSRRNSATNSNSNSRRGSRDNAGTPKQFNPNDLMGGIKKLFNKRPSCGGGEFSSQNGLLSGGGLPPTDGGPSSSGFPRPPESGAFPRTAGSVGTGKAMQGISSAQASSGKKSGGGFFSSFQSKEGHSKSEEWVDFSAGGGSVPSSDDVNVEFDAGEV